MLATLLAMMISTGLMADGLKNGDIFEYVSGENTLFCRVDKVCDDSMGTVTIVAQMENVDYHTTGNRFKEDHQPQGKIVVPAVVSDPDGYEYEVSKIKDYVFQYCHNICEAILNCKEIGFCSFAECSNLQKVTLGDNVKKMSAAAFRSTAITSINMNNVSQLSAGAQPFMKCKGLKEIIVPEDNEAFVSVDNVLYSKDMTQLVAVPCIDIEEWVGQSTLLTKIYPGAFNCIKIDRLTIPSYWGDDLDFYNFVECQIDTVYINGTYVSTGAFWNTSINHIHIGPEVKMLGDRAFLLKGKTEDIYLYGSELPDMNWLAGYDACSLAITTTAKVHVIPGYDMLNKIADSKLKWDVFENVVEDITFIPSEITSGATNISSIPLTSPSTTLQFNLSGQRVTDSYRGLIIKDGKKMWKR